MRLTRTFVALSAVALGLATAVPAQAGSQYRSLDDAELLQVVRTVDLLGAGYTHILLSGPAAESIRTRGVCEVELPVGRLAFHLVETNGGADQAAAIIDEPAAGSPAAFAKKVAEGPCDAGKLKGEGIPDGAVTFNDHDAPIPFVAVVPRGKVVLVVESGTQDALVGDAAAAVTAYDGLARTDRAS